MQELIPNFDIVLASQSPRRQQLLRDMGLQFRLGRGTEVDESFPADMPVHDIPGFLAQKKADGFRHELTAANSLLITADTLVFLDGRPIGKPTDATDAHKMLRELSGKSHEVITGVCLSSQTKQVVFNEITTVFFRELDDAEIDYYIEHYKPFDKAGSYGIQEWIGYIGIQRIEGCFFNVMGLPQQTLYRAIKQF